MSNAQRVEVVKLDVPKRAVIPNKFKVPAKQWKKWDSIWQKTTFNVVYETMLRNQEMFLHPKTDKIPPLQWKTVCWNAAWTAADALC